jgi:diguanylate cyclase (GGDEF)-like protein
MHLDGLTLMAAGSFVALLSSLALFAAWTQIRSAPALLWWSAAQLADAIGVGVLTLGFTLHAAVLSTPGLAFVILAPGLVWTGVRQFNGVRVRPLILAGGILALFAAGALPLPGDPAVSALAVTFSASAAYLLAAIGELWRSRREALMARWPLMAIFAIHAAIFVGGIGDAYTGHVSVDQVPQLNSWFSLIHFEQMVYLVGSAVFMVVLARERVELGYKQASRLDELTGVANRRAFFEHAERLLRRCRADASPCAVIVFDLDHFKQINDTHGHAAGDRVLRSFADIARVTLRPNDLFGRHGGEEFAVILPRTDGDAAVVIAERVRQAFATTSDNPDVAASRPTVSAGVAVVEGEAGLEATMEAADRALYRAKRLGRNRVERADLDHRRTDDDVNVVRVA